MPYDICIIGLKCFDHLKQETTPRYIGGIERQLTTIGRALSRAGHQVSFITYDHGQQPITMIDGIRAIKAYPDLAIRSKPFGWMRKFLSFRQSLIRADASIYIQMGAGAETGYTALILGTIPTEHRFVFFAASNADCQASLPSLTGWKEKCIYRAGLRNADQIVVQTHEQHHLMRKNFSQSSRVIPMTIEALPVVRKSSPRNSVLWIGRICPEKRPEWLLDIAPDFPHVDFIVIGENNFSSDFSVRFKTAADKLPNLRIVGKIDRERLYDHFRTAGALCCTSVIEGFPTTFLEAWSIGLPIVTSYDPDDVIAKYGIGMVADTRDSFKQALHELLASPSKGSHIGERERSYFRRHHTTEAVLARLNELLDHISRS